MLEVSEVGNFREDLTHPMNLFTGAGFSALSKNRNGRALSDGEGLKSIIIRELGLEEYASLDLQSVYAIAVSRQRDQVNSLIAKELTVDSFDKRYYGLRKIPVHSWYTTNIDDLAFRVYEPIPGEPSKILRDRLIFGAPRNENAVIDYIPLHGCIRHEVPDYIFSPGQISSAFSSDRETWYVFQRELRLRPTFFLGYAVKDAGVLQALYSTSSETAARWIVLRERSESAKALFESLGFKVAFGDTNDFLSYVSSLDGEAARGALVRSSFSYGAIPKLDQVAQRPVRNFFKGAEPEWSDAYSALIVRRQVNSRVSDTLVQDRSVVVVGLPLSDKSTILKQVAVDLQASRNCLFFDRLSEPVAAEIAAQANLSDGSRKTVVFVDNLADSRLALKLLVNTKKFIFAATETSYFFDALNVGANFGPLRVVPCSEVSAPDRQKIIESIPASIKRFSVSEDDLLSDAEEVGLFESLTRHVFDENLISRFRARLAEFRIADLEAYNVYIMACYAQRCRTIVSFDMIYMFIDRKNKTYKDIYNIVARIDDFLTSQDIVDDPHQDYFSVKSSALARIALRIIPDAAFGAVFDRFHKAVPANVIPDYLVFRRYAYDNDFAVRAYPDAASGKRFYERLVNGGDNPYDYAHGAVYLSKMRRYTEAFQWIDKAITMSRTRVFSIRNSHARILFESNIGVAEQDPRNQTAKDGLVESLAVLSECIERDPRRNYHIMRFADQTIQYYQVYRNEEAASKLAEAERYVRSALAEAGRVGSQEDYNRARYRRILADIERVKPV